MLGFLLPDQDGSFKPVELGHLDVQQHEVEPLAGEVIQALPAAQGGHRLPTAPLDHVDHHLLVDEVIVHEQDARNGTRRTGGRTSGRGHG